MIDMSLCLMLLEPSAMFTLRDSKCMIEIKLSHGKGNALKNKTNGENCLDVRKMHFRLLAELQVLVPKWGIILCSVSILQRLVCLLLFCFL